jgi:hypothetical protein
MRRPGFAGLAHHFVRNHEIAALEIRRQRAGDAEADQPAHAARDQAIDLGTGNVGATARADAHDIEAAKELCFGLEASDDAQHGPSHPMDDAGGVAAL